MKYDDRTLEIDRKLAFAIEALEVPRGLDDRIRSEYRRLAEWLRVDAEERYRADGELFPQGSLAIGTSIRPLDLSEQSDADMVFNRDILKESVTQEQLVSGLGDQLRDYVEWVARKGETPPSLEPKKRCWTLTYGGFHIDVLPSVPDATLIEREPTAILITDRGLKEWLPSNPKAYARWFEHRSATLFLESHGEPGVRKVEVDDIPFFRRKTVLQRLVQLAKRHRDLACQGDAENKPPSIQVTTLVGTAYGGQASVYQGLLSLRDRMRAGIKRDKDGRWEIPSPVADENFAHKWKAHPEREMSFFKWLKSFESFVGLLEGSTGLISLNEAFTDAWGNGVAQSIFERTIGETAEQRYAGALKMSVVTGALGSTGVSVKPNDFYGS